MGAPRRKNNIPSRRKAGEEGDEESSVASGIDDDSLSEGSAISNDADDDADAEGSEASEVEKVKRISTKTNSPSVRRPQAVNGKRDDSTADAKSSVPAVRDTQVMMNGLRISGDLDETEGIEFETMGEQPEQRTSASVSVEKPSSNAPVESIAERRRREHEEYKQKRDADPAFVPNRGGFFMHDHRSAAPGQNGFRPFGRGRGRGRGGVGGTFPASSQTVSTVGLADEPWAHDLHDTVSKPTGAVAEDSAPKQPSTGMGPPQRAPPPNRSFSKSTRLGSVQVRLHFPGMKEQVLFSAVPVNQYTRLPHHRPPLRRDKPVRVSLPGLPSRYIFPVMERSFIFIPRALRPNQQPFGRGRGRNSFGTYSGFPSRKTSAYGGSNYSPSISVSRRSSRDGFISPTGSTMSRPQILTTDSGKPIVRLPPSSDRGQALQSSNLNIVGAAPVVNLPPPQSYSLPQKPLSRENRPTAIPMHQPRPQKAVSVGAIESPATLSFNPPQQQQQQPFHHQVPQANGQAVAADQGLYPHSRHPSHPSQTSGGTPLSQIPERAIHAQPFQPYPYQQPHGYYPQQYPPPVYFYPQPAPAIQPSVAAPAFVPGQQYPYLVPPAPPSATPEEGTQTGTVAHESNGMVYYYDSSQLPANDEQPPRFTPNPYQQPANFVYPQPAVFYPPQ